MFTHFCTALALECLYMRHGRAIVLEMALGSYVETVEVFEVMAMEAMPAGSVH